MVTNPGDDIEQEPLSPSIRAHSPARQDQAHRSTARMMMMRGMGVPPTHTNTNVEDSSEDDDDDTHFDRFSSDRDNDTDRDHADIDNDNAMDDEKSIPEHDQDDNHDDPSPNNPPPPPPHPHIPVSGPVPASFSPDSSANEYRWRFPNFPSVFRMNQNRVVSDEFVLLGAKWRLLLFPSGNQSHNHVALYLELCSLPPNHTCPVEFKFTVIHPSNASLNISRDSPHEFNERDVDRGFADLIPHHNLSHYYHPGNTLVIQISLQRNMNEPLYRRIPEYKLNNYDSKKSTGYVGLKNQGATCYMNSFLQSLFHILACREAVYAMPVDTSGASGRGSIGFALQKLFYGLQTSPSAQSTKELTKSFGWDSMEAFMQHDVEEFAKVLLDSLDQKMKGTSVEGAIPKLFEFKLENYVECIHVNYKSSRTQPETDLKLQVRGCGNLEAAFDKYVEVETLEGANKYRAEGHGLQDARKGTRFLQFPPVLQLHLSRFEFDSVREAMLKINDRFEFPKELNLSRFLPPSSIDPSDPPIYHLHSILVHSGSVHGGHYYAFIRPLKKNKEYKDCEWYKFDDDDVHLVTEAEAVEGSYGGESEFPAYTFGQKRMEKRLKMSNAYLLVYLRQSFTTFHRSVTDSVVTPQTPVSDAQQTQDIEGVEKGKEKGEREPAVEDPSKSVMDVPIPQSLREAFEAEKIAVEKKREAEARAHLYMDLKLIVENDLIGKGLGVEFQVETVDDNGQIVYVDPEQAIKVEKKAPLTSVSNEIKSMPPTDQSYWKFTVRENQTRRPNQSLLNASMTFEEVWRDQGKQSTLYVRDMRVDDKYNSVCPAGIARSLTTENSSNNDSGDRCILAIKFFNVRTQTITLLGSGIFLKSCLIAQVKEFIRNALKDQGHWPQKPSFSSSSSPSSSAPDNPVAAIENMRLTGSGAPANSDDVPLIVWEEEVVKAGRINLLVDSKTLRESSLRNGDILLAQFQHTDAELELFREEHESKYEAYQAYLEQTKHKSMPMPSPSPSPVPPDSLHHSSTPTSTAFAPPSTVPPSNTASPASLNSGNSLAPPGANANANANAPAPVPVKHDFFNAAPEYLRYLLFRVVVEFRSTPWRSHPDDPNRAHSSCMQLMLELTMNMTHEQVLKRLSAATKLDWEKLRLTLPSVHNREPHQPVKHPLNAMLSDFLKDPHILYFSSDEFSFADLQRNRVVPMIYTDLAFNEIRFNVLVPKGANVSHLQQAVYEKLVTLVNDNKIPADGGLAKLMAGPKSPTQARIGNGSVSSLGVPGGAPVAEAGASLSRSPSPLPEDDGVGTKKRKLEGEEEDTGLSSVSSAGGTRTVETVESLREKIRLRLLTVPPSCYSDQAGTPTVLKAEDSLSQYLDPAYGYSNFNLSDKKELRADVIAPEHFAPVQKNEHLFWMTYFTHSPHAYSLRTFGYPFVVVVKEGESMADFKVRLTKRLGIPEERAPKLELAKIIFMEAIPYKDDEPLSAQVTLTDMLGVRDPEYRPKPGSSSSSRLSRGYSNNRAIKIHA